MKVMPSPRDRNAALSGRRRRKVICAKGVIFLKQTKEKLKTNLPSQKEQHGAGGEILLGWEDFFLPIGRK